MPYGNENPYMTNVSPDVGWGNLNNFWGSVEDAGGINPEYFGELISDFPDMFTNYMQENFPDQLSSFQPMYQYQGMSPEIMQALGGAFHLPSDIQSLAEITNELEGFMGFPEGLGGAFDPPAWDEEGFDEYYSTIGQGEGGIIPEDWFLGNLAPEQLFGMSVSNLEYELPESAYDDPSYLIGTDIFDPGSIAATLSQMGGMEGAEQIRPGEVAALTPEMIGKTESAYYEPYETSERKKLVGKLSSARGDISPGGFAGSGGYQGQLSGAERMYRKGYGGVLEDIMEMKGGATEDVLDKIYGWQELLQSQTGPI